MVHVYPVNIRALKFVGVTPPRNLLTVSAFKASLSNPSEMINVFRSLFYEQESVLLFALSRSASWQCMYAQ